MNIALRCAAGVLAAIVLLPSPAATQTVGDVCTVTSPPELSDLTIDARTGTATGRKRYRQHQEIRVIVLNKNPYLFDYQLEIKDSPVPGPSTGAFLGLFGITFETPDPAAAKKAAEVAAAGIEKAVAGLPPKVCPNADELQNGTDGLIAGLSTATEAWKKVEATLDEASKAHATATKVFENANADCKQLHGASSTFLAALKDFKFAPEAVQKALVQLENDATEQNARIVRAQADPAGLCTKEAARAAAALTGIRTESAKLQRNVTTGQEAAKKLEAAKMTVQDTLTTPHAFTQTEIVGDFDQPTNVTVTLSRRQKKPDATFAKLGSRELNFGGKAIFAVSGGWSLGWVARVEYAARDGQPRDREGNPIGDPTKSVPIVEQIEDSKPRSGPSLLGHVRLVKLPWYVFSGIHATIGLTPQSDNNATGAEVLLGGSLSLADEWLFLSFTSYRGWQQTLEGSFYPGKALPEGTSTVPVGKSEKWGAGLSLSLRLR